MTATGCVGRIGKAVKVRGPDPNKAKAKPPDKQDRKAEAEKIKSLGLPSPAHDTVALKDIVQDGNCRRYLDKAQTAELCMSLRAHGQLVPIVVNAIDQKLVLVCGYRRVTAARELKWTHLAANIYLRLTEEQVRNLQLIENLHRAALAPADEAVAIATLIGKGTKKRTIEEVASLLAVVPEYVRRRLRLLRLSASVRNMIQPRGALPVAHAEVLAPCSAADQLRIAKWAVHVGYGWAEGDAVSRGLSPADFVQPLPEVRAAVSDVLRTLAGKPWPMDEPFGKKRACDGCQHNSLTVPGLFEGLAAPGKVGTKRGFCANAQCFEAKVTQADRNKAARKKAEAKAGGGKKKTADKEAAADKPAGPAWESTDRGKAQQKMYHHGRKLVAELKALLKKTKPGTPLMGELLIIHARMSVAQRGGTDWKKTMSRLTVALSQKPALALEGSTLLLLLPELTGGYLWQSPPAEYSQLGGMAMIRLALVEALAKRLGIKIPDRPVKESEILGKDAG